MPSCSKLLAVQLIIVVAATLYDTYHTWYDATSCQEDPPVRLHHVRRSLGRVDGGLEGGVGMTNMVVERNLTWNDSCRLFSTEYIEARAKFQRAVARYPQAQTYSLPVFDVDDGDGGESPLTIDVAVFPGTLPGKTIFHSSGLHGVEGYAGSAIQLALLEEGVLPLGNGNDDDDDDNNNRPFPTLVLLHALNPVGMLQHRRCNENNVDLNRNCLWNKKQQQRTQGGENGEEGHDQTQKFFDAFVENRDPNVASYDDFRSFLAPPQQVPTSFYSYFGLWIRAVPELLKHGYTKLKRSMVSGQYHHSHGLFYGGDRRQPSIDQLVHFLDTVRPDLLYGQQQQSVDRPDDDDDKAAEQSPTESSVVWLDVHTGLGPFGKDSLHCEVAAAADKLPTEDDVKRLFPSAYRSTIAFASANDDSSAFSGYDLAEGGMTTMLRDKWEVRRQQKQEQQQPSSSTSSSSTGLFVLQEFGTLPGILVGRGLILDNMLYHNSPTYFGKDPQLSYRSPWLKLAFYPQSTVWRSSVLQRGVALVLGAVDFTVGLDE